MIYLRSPVKDASFLYSKDKSEEAATGTKRTCATNNVRNERKANVLYLAL